MDTGNGKFEMLEAVNNKLEEAQERRRLLEEKYPNHGAWFREGEEVEIKGSLFRVKRIKPTEITFKLLARKTT